MPTLPFLRGFSSAKRNIYKRLFGGSKYADEALRNAKNGLFEVTPEDLEEYMRKKSREMGTTSFFELPYKLLTKVPGIKKALPSEEVFNNKLYTFHKKMDELDRAAGKKLQDTIPFGKSIFNYQDTVPKVYKIIQTGVDEAGKPIYKKEYLVGKENVIRASAPLEKSKAFLAPMAGVIGVEYVANEFSKNKNNGLTTESEYKNFLIEKIASSVGNRTRQTISSTPVIDKSMLDKYAMIEREKLEKAASLLKTASQKIKELEREVTAIEEDNRRLTLQIIAKERSRRAVKLAREMIEKGLIKQAQFEEEVDRIMDMDDSAFEVLQSAVSNIQKQATTLSGLTTTAFVINDDSGSGYKKSLAESILEK